MKAYLFFRSVYLKFWKYKECKNCIHIVTFIIPDSFPFRGQGYICWVTFISWCTYCLSPSWGKAGKSWQAQPWQVQFSMWSLDCDKSTSLGTHTSWSTQAISLWKPLTTTENFFKSARITANCVLECLIGNAVFAR